MAYDGFYGGLSARASVSEVLNQANRVSEEIKVSKSESEASAVRSETSAGVATAKASAAAASAALATGSVGYVEAAAADAKARLAVVVAGANAVSVSAELTRVAIGALAATATTARDQAVTASDISEANKNTTGAMVSEVVYQSDRAATAAGRAETAKAAAESAKDTVNLAVGRKVDIVEGLATTVDGETFTVLSPSNNEYILEYKNNAGVALLLKTYPSSQAIQAVRLTSGNIFDKCETFGQAFAGASLIRKSGRITGLRIPSGQTGNSTYIRAQLGLQSQIPVLVGTKILIEMYLTANETFVADTVMTSLVMQVLRAGSISTVTPESQSLTQAGNLIKKTVTYTLAPGDLDVYPVFRPGISTVAYDRVVEVVDVSYSVITQPATNSTISDYHLAQRLEPLSTSISDNTITSGNIVETGLHSYYGELFAGATGIVDRANNRIGVSIPAGSTGASTYLSPFAKVDGAKLAGSTLKMVAVFETSADFYTECPPSSVKCQVVRGAGRVNGSFTNIVEDQSGTTLTKSFDYVITADDLAVAPTYQISSTNLSKPTVRYMKIVSIKYSLANLPVGLSSADAMLSVQIGNAVDALGLVGKAATVTVGPTGADFDSIQSANATMSGSSSKSPNVIALANVVGPYEALNVVINDHVSLVGEGSTKVHIHHEEPDNVDPVAIQGIQTLYLFKNHTLRNTKVTCKNSRYAIHCESGNRFQNGTILVEDSEIEHQGNYGAQAYQDSIRSGVRVWASYHAWGYGASSGQKVIMNRTKLISPTSAFYVHTNLDYEKPLSVEINESELLTYMPGGKSVYLQPLGSNQPDSVVIRNTKLVGDVYYWCNPWFPNTLDRQPADHCEISLTLSGCSAAAFEILEFGRALKIESKLSTPLSSVAVSGSAVTPLFGRETFVKPGANGLPAYVYGWGDISGTNVGSPTVGNITSLGKRLGNCAATAKFLNVVVDGAAPVAITFNKDYTNLSNATIFAEINTALSGVAVASAYNVGGRFRPLVIDEELNLRNTSTEGILMGMALAYDTSLGTVRKIKSTDTVEVFAGIALEDIYPDTFGRVKTKGHVKITDLVGLSGTATFMQPVFVDPTTDGKLTLTVGSNPVMKAARSDVVEVAPK